MKPNIIYEAFPADKLKTVKQLTNKYKCLLPPWLQYLKILYLNVRSDDGSSASCSTDYNYRWSVISLFIGAFEDNDLEQTFLHEILHITQAPLTQYIDKLVESQESIIKQTYNGLVEQCNCDMTMMIKDLFDKK